MNSDISNPDYNDDDKQVNIADVPVSMKLVQHIYNEFTGKTEKISSRLRDNHEINFADLEQLDTKINQLYEQYTIVSKSCSVVVYHVNDCKSEYSTFERFKLYDTSTNSPCENVRLEYNFLIILPETNKPQSYKIEIQLKSRVGANKKAELEHGTSRRIFFKLLQGNGFIKIEYVDYTVARNFMVAMEDWYNSLHKNSTNKFVLFLQDHSHHIPFLCATLTTIFVTYVIFLQSENFISSNPTLSTLFGGIIISAGALILSGNISYKIGNFLERSIDMSDPISFVKINRGDKKAITEFNKSRNKNIRNGIFSILGIILLNIFTSYISHLFGF